MRFLDLYTITGSHLNEPETPAYTYGRYIPENDLDKKMLVQCAIATARSIIWEFERPAFKSSPGCNGIANLTDIKFDDHGFGQTRLDVQKTPFNPLTFLDDLCSFDVVVWIDRGSDGKPLGMWRLELPITGEQSNSLNYPPVIDWNLQCDPELKHKNAQ
jgi:hypothetical protein